MPIGTKVNSISKIQFIGLGTIEVTEINTKSIDVSVPREELAIGIVNADAFLGANKLMVV